MYVYRSIILDSDISVNAFIRLPDNISLHTFSNDHRKWTIFNKKKNI